MKRLGKARLGVTIIKNTFYKFTFTLPVILLEGHPNIIGKQKSLFNPFRFFVDVLSNYVLKVSRKAVFVFFFHHVVDCHVL